MIEAYLCQVHQGLPPYRRVWTNRKEKKRHRQQLPSQEPAYSNKEITIFERPRETKKATRIRINTIKNEQNPRTEPKQPTIFFLFLVPLLVPLALLVHPHFLSFPATAPPDQYLLLLSPSRPYPPRTPSPSALHPSATKVPPRTQNFQTLPKRGWFFLQHSSTQSQEQRLLAVERSWPKRSPQRWQTLEKVGGREARYGPRDHERRQRTR
jgi:hypothetical protein